MRRRLLIGIAACLYYSGLVALARWLTERSGQHLIILNYHRASNGNLRRHLNYLRQYYRLVSIETALEELYEQRMCEKRRRRQRTSLAVTFDDGYRDNYTHAFALARELEVPISIYLVPGYIESGAPFWWVESHRLVKQARTRDVHIEGCVYHLNNPRDCTMLAHLIDTRARYAQSVVEREAFLAAMRKKLQVAPEMLTEEEGALPLSWEQVQEMKESGWVSFGAHTLSHPILSYLTDPAEVRREVELCRHVLEQRLAQPVRTFAYPIGQQQHSGDEVVHTMQQAGYEWAMTTQYGSNTPKNNPYLLRRIEVDVDQHWLILAAETAGLWGFFSRLRWVPFIRRYFTNSS